MHKLAKIARTGIFRQLVLTALIGFLSVEADAIVVEFPDPHLEQLVRREICKPTGDILDTDLVGVGFTQLNCQEDGIVDLAGLEYCTDLEVIKLRWNGISDIAPLESLVNLRELDLVETDVTDFSPLATLQNLEILRAGGEYRVNELSDMSSLSGLTSLKKLVVSLCKVSDISPLAGLANLESLNLNTMPITDISPLAGLANLRTLGLNVTPISDITPLAGLTNLTRLSLIANRIRDISPLAGLIRLEDLKLGYCYYSARYSLGGNQVSDITPLAALTNLRLIELSHNAISDISVLANLTNLENVDLSDNMVSDISPLVANTSMADGDRVYLYGNPLGQEALCNDITALRQRGVAVSSRGTCGGTPPVIRSQPHSAVVEFGMPFTLTVEASGSGTIDYWWRKDGFHINTPPYERPMLPASWHEEASSCEDTGWYTCLVSDDNGWTISEPAYLQVLPQGDVDRSGSVDATDVQLVINAALGLDVQYKCDVNDSGGVDATDIQLVINAALGLD